MAIKFIRNEQSDLHVDRFIEVKQCVSDPSEIFLL